MLKAAEPEVEVRAWVLSEPHWPSVLREVRGRPTGWDGEVVGVSKDERRLNTLTKNIEEIRICLKQTEPELACPR